MLCTPQAGRYMERAKQGGGTAPGSPELLQSALQQAQRLLTRVWEWLCSLFGYRWQSPQESKVLYRAHLEGGHPFCHSVLFRHQHAAIKHRSISVAPDWPRYESHFLLVGSTGEGMPCSREASTLNVNTLLRIRVHHKSHLGDSW